MAQKLSELIILRFLTDHLPRLVLSSVLFLGGIFLISLRLPGWSLILGLPAIQIGLVFLIFTFDKIAHARFGIDNLRHLPCLFCGQPTLASPWQEEKVCRDCRARINEETRKKKKVSSSF